MTYDSIVIHSCKCGKGYVRKKGVIMFKFKGIVFILVVFVA